MVLLGSFDGLFQPRYSKKIVASESGCWETSSSSRFLSVPPRLDLGDHDLLDNKQGNNSHKHVGPECHVESEETGTRMASNDYQKIVSSNDGIRKIWRGNSIPAQFP